MSMSDCEKCWDTPCTCGWEYRHMPSSARMKLAAVILGCSPSSLIGVTPERHPDYVDSPPCPPSPRPTYLTVLDEEESVPIPALTEAQTKALLKSMSKVLSVIGERKSGAPRAPIVSAVERDECDTPSLGTGA